MRTQPLIVHRATNAAPVETLEPRRLLAVHLWTGAVDGNWSNPANWSGGAPALGETALELHFPAGAARSTTTNDIGNLAIDTLRIGQGSYEIQGQPITLRGLVSAELEEGSHRIANNITLAADVRIETTGASSIDGRALIFNGVIAGSGGITKYGHNVRLNADNTYTGLTTLEGGGISINGQQPQGDIIVESGEVSGRGRIGSLTFGDAFGSLGSPVQPSVGLIFDGLPILDGDLALTEATYFRPVLGAVGGTQVVNGFVTLGGATLSATYTDSPALGESFILLANDGVDQIDGTFAGLPEGATFTILDKDVVITYAGGDGNDVEVTVLGSEVATRTTLTASAPVVQPGESVTLTVAVSPINTAGITPGGTVRFFRDDVLIATRTLDADGRATLTISDLPLRGSTRFHAAYDGEPDAAILPSRSDDQRVRVVLAGQTETALYIAPPSDFAGQPALLIARITGLGIPAGTPTGSVQFFIGDNLVGTVTLDADGRAEMTATHFPVGLVDVRAIYSGDGTFITSQASTTRLTRLIQGRYYPTATTLALSSRRSSVGQPITLTATITRLPGDFSQPYGGTVTFFDGSTRLGSAPVSAAGQAVFTISTLPAGSHALAARYDGNAVYFTSSSGVHPHAVVAAPAIQSLGNATAALAVVADIDRDGQADLVWHDAATGLPTVQFLNAAGDVQRTAVLPAVSDPRWVLEGAGIFNAQDQADLIWRNTATGRLLLWRIDGERLAGIHTIATTPLAAGWRVGGTGDVDTDGDDDIIWRNDNTGQAVVWFMKRNTVAGVAGLGPVARDLDWRLDGVGDVNGDGRPDLLWINQKTHRAAAWHMRGTAFIGFQPLGPAPGPGWRIAGLADLNSDAAPDLLFRNTTSGAVRMWTIGG